MIHVLWSAGFYQQTSLQKRSVHFTLSNDHGVFNRFLLNILTVKMMTTKTYEFNLLRPCRCLHALNVAESRRYLGIILSQFSFKMFSPDCRGIWACFRQSLFRCYLLKRHPDVFGARTCQEASTLVCRAYRTQNGGSRVLLSPLSAGNMAKNKQKGKKQKNVFQVANKHLKNKNKAKPVTTALKHVRSDELLDETSSVSFL